MRKTTVLRLRGIKFSAALSKSNGLLLMLLCLILGILLGAIKIKYSDGDFITKTIKGFLIDINVMKSGFLKTFFHSAGLWLPFAVAFFLSGTSLAGMAAAPLILAYYGYMYGIFAGFLYSSYSIMGIGFCLLVILPGRAMCAFAMCLASRESFAFSKVMARVTLQAQGSARTYYDFKNYCLRYLFILLLLLGGALFDCLFFKAFGGFFSF